MKSNVPLFFNVFFYEIEQEINSALVSLLCSTFLSALSDSSDEGREQSNTEAERIHLNPMTGVAMSRDFLLPSTPRARTESGKRRELRDKSAERLAVGAARYIFHSP